MQNPTEAFNETPNLYTGDGCNMVANATSTTNEDGATTAWTNAGFATFEGRSVLVLGQEKGEDLDGRLKRNFGMMRPEGYRKCIRLMKLANKFNIPVISFVDTPGAYPGIGAEQRGQAEAIASSINCCMSLEVPIISIIIGEGGSGGAIALASANKVIMLEHAIYSVISPEGCASILWRDPNISLEAANAMKLTA